MIINSIADLRELARKRVPRAIFEYADQGAYDEITFRLNQHDLDTIEFRQRVMIDVSHQSLATTLVGEAATIPLAIAPTGLTGLFRANSENARCARRGGFRKTVLSQYDVDLLDRGRSQHGDETLLVSNLSDA